MCRYFPSTSGCIESDLAHNRGQIDSLQTKLDRVTMLGTLVTIALAEIDRQSQPRPRPFYKRMVII